MKDKNNSERIVFSKNPESEAVTRKTEAFHLDPEKNNSNHKIYHNNFKDFFSNNKFLIFTVLLFIVIFGVRIYFSLNTQYFSNEASYQHLRYAKNIAENGPFSTDYLVFDGRKISFLSMYDNILAFLSLIFDLNMIAKILNELLCAAFILITFIISKEITKNEKASFVAAVSAALIPYFTKNTFNSSVPETACLFLIMILLLLFLKIRQNKKLSSLYVFILVLASSISPLILIFTISLITFYIVSSAYGIRLEKYEKELIIFSLFVSIIIELLFLRETLIASGFSTIWGNIPQKIIGQWFPNLSLTYTAFLLGIATVIIAFRTTYINLVKKNNPSFFIIFGIIMTTFLFLWLRVMKFEIGVLIISVMLPIITSYFFADLEDYLKMTKISDKTNHIIFAIVCIIILTNALPTITSITSSKTVVNKYDIAALEWLKDNTYPQETVFCMPQYGNIVAYFAERKVVANSDFLGIRNIDAIFEDINFVKTSTVKTNVIGILNKYNVSYLVFNRRMDENTFNNRMFYDKCFEEIYLNKEIRILKLKCTLE